MVTVFIVDLQSFYLHKEQIFVLGAIFFSDEDEYRDAFDSVIDEQNEGLEDIQIKAINRFISPDDDSLKIYNIGKVKRHSPKANIQNTFIYSMSAH